METVKKREINYIMAMSHYLVYIVADNIKHMLHTLPTCMHFSNTASFTEAVVILKS